MNEERLDPATATYVSLATFRRNGEEVRTPVWIAGDNERYYVFSEAKAGKVKRIRANGRARLAACDMRGNVTGQWREASARIVTDTTTIKHAYIALHAKYGWQMKVADFFSKLTGRYQQRAMLEIADLRSVT
ncbi:MAG: PPOX class F420-dependent oxidoreductase [Pseudomonadota bacterium]